MDKSKAIRNIIIYIIIIMMCMFFIGFFTAKKAYAANGEELPAPPLESNETYFILKNIHSGLGNIKAAVFNINGTTNNINAPIYYSFYDKKLYIDNVTLYYWENNIWNFQIYYNASISITSNIEWFNFDMLSVPIYYAEEIDGVWVLTDEVFFFPESRLSGLMARIPMTEITKEILSMMTISLGLVVSFLGLRKVLAWLLKILKTA